ncbi:hypothetical protein ACHAWC_009554 [Mediolabrus comicus]
MSYYPKDTPKLKHDLLCPSSIIDDIINSNARSSGGEAIIASIDSLTTSIVKSATPLTSLPPNIHKLTTIYTYNDAPTSPKPISSAPRIWKLVSRNLFNHCCHSSSSQHEEKDGSLLKRCTVAVKLPKHIKGSVDNDPKIQKDIKNSKLFHNFIIYLQQHDLVAMLACDSAGRVGFVVPTANDNSSNGSDDDNSYVAYLYYANMKMFIPWARENYVKSTQQQQQHGNHDGDDDWDNDGGIKSNGRSATWTPQYTPPPLKNDDDNTKVMEEQQGGSGSGSRASWTPQYTPPPEDECGIPRGWTPPPPDDETTTNGGSTAADDVELFKPPGNHDNDDGTAGLFKPPGTSSTDGWNTANDGSNNNMTDGTFHANKGAAAADEFYSKLTRNLDTRADSRLYHMRSFNGWVKATQISELDPDIIISSSAGESGGDNKKRARRAPLRVLDLACGKGGDLGKWTLHQRGIENYVGIDVARGSLIDAALRARVMSRRNKHKLKKCTFTLADLGEDVPGRKRSMDAKRMQKLLSWTMQNETLDDKEDDPRFVPVEGGGIAESDKFDVVSIQFAIHYMMQTRKRARRFFHTVSSLLEIGGNLIATTIDARVVIEKLMGLGLDLHFDEMDQHEEVDQPANENVHHNGNKRRRITDDENDVVVTVGGGVCRLKFDAAVVRKIFHPSHNTSSEEEEEDMFGLQYTFTLVEGSDHAAGVGEAVDLPEWLTPIPALKELAQEAGLEMEYAKNFHSFYGERKDPTKFPAAHNALYNMKVLNRNGSISEQEWDVSRMYVAVKFRKVRESSIHISDEDIGEDEL